MKRLLMVFIVLVLVLAPLCGCAEAPADNSSVSTPGSEVKDTSRDSDSTESINSSVTEKPDMSSWNPNVEYRFDDEKLTVSDFYEQIPVLFFVEDLRDEKINQHVIIYCNNVVIQDGFIEEGMKVEVYRNDTIYGIYTVVNLKKVK